jgi:hypothetical protein
MRVTEQIDALEALGVDSFKYLVVTQVVACVIAPPVLTVLMDFSGLVGGIFRSRLAGGRIPDLGTAGRSRPRLSDEPFSIKAAVHGHDAFERFGAGTDRANPLGRRVTGHAHLGARFSMLAKSFPVCGPRGASPFRTFRTARRISTVG